jgi:glycosyltransferase involved in cell wall biosynthesis
MIDREKNDTPGLADARKAKRQPPLLTVAFAPDYRDGIPYQALLAGALEDLGVKIDFFSPKYDRFLPLSRDCYTNRPDILHLHWPEHYFKHGNAFQRNISRIGYSLDLKIVHATRKLVVTAHNLTAHGSSTVVDPLVARTFGIAGLVFAHSEQAKIEIERRCRISGERIEVIPVGDLLALLPPLVEPQIAREQLQLPLSDKLALVFGRIAPYKGIEELLTFWNRSQLGVNLVIVGDSVAPGFTERLSKLANDSKSRIILRAKRVSDEQLALYLSAADCAVFNYPSLLTSGSAVLARSAGLPILFPSWLRTVDLGEPAPRVFRFDKLDKVFTELLHHAVDLSRDSASAADWRTATRWEAVATKTVQAYRSVL